MSKQQEDNLVSLVGRRCTVKCKLDNKDTRALWDTGAMISLISKNWLIENGYTKEVQSISDLIGQELTVENVNGMSIPYEGYVNIVFTIGDCDPLTVPFLVTQESILQPIIGYNVISHVMQSPENTFSTTTFPGLNEAQINKLSALLSTVPERYISEVRTTKQGVTLRANSVTAVPCKIDGLVMDRATPVLFDPMINHAYEGVLQINESFVTLKRGVRNRVCISIVNLSNSDIVMPGRLLIGKGKISDTSASKFQRIST